MIGKVILILSSVLAVGVASVWAEDFLNQHESVKWSPQTVAVEKLNLLSASTTTETQGTGNGTVVTPSPSNNDGTSTGDTTGNIGSGNSSDGVSGGNGNQASGVPVTGKIDSFNIITAPYNGKNGVIVVTATVKNTGSSTLAFDNTNQNKLLVWLTANGTFYPYSWQAAQGYGLGDTSSKSIAPGQSLTVVLHFLTGLPPDQLKKDKDIVHIGFVGSDFALDMPLSNGQ